MREIRDLGTAATHVPVHLLRERHRAQEPLSQLRRRRPEAGDGRPRSRRRELTLSPQCSGDPFHRYHDSCGSKTKGFTDPAPSPPTAHPQKTRTDDPHGFHLLTTAGAPAPPRLSTWRPAAARRARLGGSARRGRPLPGSWRRHRPGRGPVQAEVGSDLSRLLGGAHQRSAGGEHPRAPGSEHGIVPARLLEQLRSDGSSRGCARHRHVSPGGWSSIRSSDTGRDRHEALWTPSPLIGRA